MQFSMQNVLTVALVTMAVIWVTNQAAARFPMARKIIRGGPVQLATAAPVPATPSFRERFSI